MDDKRNTVDKYRELESDDLSVDEQPLYPEKQGTVLEQRVRGQPVSH